MPDEALRILVLRAVIGVRIQDQLGVGDVLLEDVRVDRVNDHVVIAIDDQRRLMNADRRGPLPGSPPTG
jgi:hypothetical protein